MSEVICVLALLSANRLISAIESMDNGKPIRGATRYVTQQSTPDNVYLHPNKRHTVSHDPAIPRHLMTDGEMADIHTNM